MLRCLSCSSQVPDGSRYCPSCAAPLTPSSATPTLEMDPLRVAEPPTRKAGSDPSRIFRSDSFDESRFLPGTMLVGRYRIIGLLGRGGMGEVYRADDVRLGQTVALKFLPEGLEKNQDRLQRFFNEVRTARQVTHPNVCRVYDIGEVDPSTAGGDGHHFISMEYVDGEDLATLLRRIGRLPGDKAVQIARQLCAGLAAAHEQGILHRDLKPANVMLDGRGRVRITDFGLAGLAEAFEGKETRAGTPAYMAPEQAAGRGVSVRSDLYSLGLVLYELFTGKPAFTARTPGEFLRLQQETTPTSPSSHLEDLDPGVDAVILRCLEKDPAQRPASALAVAAALPGGDPLAAALAAGETPSPEMVAAAGPQGGLRPPVALACLAIVHVGIALGALLAPMTRLHERLPLGKTLEALKENGRAILGELGYTEPFKDSDASFQFEVQRFMQMTQREPARTAWESLSRPGQVFVGFLYRQRSGQLVPRTFTGRVSANDPPASPGDITMKLDLSGRLTYLRAVPPFVETSPEPERPGSWEVLFDAAGLEMKEFEPTDPTVQPPVFSDSRMAWKGVLQDHADMPVRIEAAALRGKPVYFEKITPYDSYWFAATLAEHESDSGQDRALVTLLVMGLILATLLIAGAVFLALRNLKSGRGDRRGALRIAIYVFALRMLHWLVGGHHVASPGEIVLIMVALGGALLLALLSWTLYVALEPYVRRLWPEALVSWSRLLAGRFRDPLVGRDLLVGLTLGMGLHLYFLLSLGALEWLGLPPIPDTDSMISLRGGRFVVAELFLIQMASLAVPMVYLLMFLLLRIILRRQWLAMTAFCLILAALTSQQFAFVYGGQTNVGGVAFGAALGLSVAVILLVLLVRFGFLATAAAFVFTNLLTVYPITTDVSAPYFAASLFGMLVTAALAIYAFYRSLAGQPIFKDAIIAE